MTDKSKYLPVYALNQLADRVAMKVDYINLLYKADNVWDRTIDQCLKIEDNPRNVSTVTIDAKKESGIAINGTNIRWYHIKLTLIYIILYYKHSQNVPYWKPVFNQLIKNMGVYADDKILKTKIQQEIDNIKEEDKLLEQEALKSKNGSAASIPSIPSAKDMAEGRKKFIQAINEGLVEIETIDWANVTIAFDRDVMKEIFWGIEDDKTLQTVVKAIINTWNILFKAKDRRCIEKSAVDSMMTTLSPWKFDGLLKCSIDDFFADLWVERNARNVYATSKIEKLFAPPTPEQDLSADATEVEKVGSSNPSEEDELLRKKLAEVVAEKEKMSTTIESLKNDLLAFKTRDKKGKDIPLFTAKQVAIFIKAIFLENNSLTNNVKNLAPLVQGFGGGWAPTTAENALGYEVLQDECNDLAKVFDDYAPKISNIIRDYPNKFKQVKGQKLQNNLKS